ncbi:DnaJ C-terminal domain-containing protein [Salinactinospora qingdaonensis]|uniref:J domain-containing protein n=1 Tax=Salinactinospora qingdaonensis TaxID=702744 RepID=A0ABP7FFK9_9ACTN
MSSPEDPYAVLGVRSDATQEQILRSFRALARRYHPDTSGGDHDAFARVRAAYETLADPARRAAYDAAYRPRSSRTPRSPGITRIPVRVRDDAPRRGSDITARLNLGLAEAVGGATVDVDLGGGDRAQVSVPAGATHRQRLRVRGAGEAGRNGGPRGDLLVTLLVSDHPTYWRVGRDLHTSLTLSYPEAVAGAVVAITTLLGKEVHLTVPPATAPGDRLRLPGHGVPGGAQRAAGDLVVHIALDIPTRLAPEQHTALNRLAEALPPPAKDPRR